MSMQSPGVFATTLQAVTNFGHLPVPLAVGMPDVAGLWERDLSMGDISDISTGAQRRDICDADEVRF